MLLYATYTPKKINSWNRERVFAFASEESAVQAYEFYNHYSDKGTLFPVLRSRLIKEGASMATLIQWDDETKQCKETATVYINSNSIRESWDGKHKEIQLVEKEKDVVLPDMKVYS